mgnify:CR=1 FL=1
MNFSEMAMPVATSATEPRHAALLLHAMSAADRNWILAQMPEVQQQALHTLLAELEALGIPPDKSSLERLQQGGDIQPLPILGLAGASNEPTEGGLDLMALDAMKIASLAQAWRAEPALLVAQALCLRPWPWRPALLERLPALQRQRVMDVLGAQGDRLRPGPAMAAAMLDCMRECCQSSGSDSTASAGGSPTKAGVLVVARHWHSWWPWRRRSVLA